MMSANSLRRGLITAGVTALLVACSVIAGAKIWTPGVTIERHIIEPVQRVVASPSETETLPDLIDAACPAIVAIKQGTARPAGKGKAVPAPRAGTVISADGAIVTSGRQLSLDQPVEVAFNDGRTVTGTVAVIDPLSGLAIIKADAKNLTVLRFADTDLPRTGTWGFALFSPAGRGCAMRIGAVEQDFIAGGDALRAWITIGAWDAPVADGTPFIARDGRILAIAGPGDDSATANANHFIPGIVAARATSEMLRSGAAPAAPSGLIATNVGPIFSARLLAGRQRGAAVVLIDSDSRADVAGLKAGDIVLTANGIPIAGPSELDRTLNSAAGTIKLEVQRRGGRMQIELGPAPAE